MRNIEERRELTQRKLAKRTNMLKTFGSRGGTIYERHIEKINSSSGYMRDGNVSHYIRVGFGQKTNNKGNHGKRYNPSIRDQKSDIEAAQQIEELNIR